MRTVYIFGLISACMLFFSGQPVAAGLNWGLGNSNTETWSKLDSSQNRVRLTEVQSLIFKKDEFTTGRRSSPIPQLNCIGGSAMNEAHLVQNIQCQNLGSDGRDVTWKCTAPLDSNLRLGKTTVSCEGYDSSNDPYILVGSCGLKYSLNYAPGRLPTSLVQQEVTTITDRSSFSDIIPAWPLVILVLMLGITCVFVAVDQNTSTHWGKLYTGTSHHYHGSSSGNDFLTGMAVGSNLVRPNYTYTSPARSDMFRRATTSTTRPNNSHQNTTPTESTSYATTERR